MTCAYVALDLLNQICYINFNDFGKAVCSCQSGHLVLVSFFLSFFQLSLISIRYLIFML
jgi:hypothetical protein